MEPAIERGRIGRQQAMVTVRDQETIIISPIDNAVCHVHLLAVGQTANIRVLQCDEPGSSWRAQAMYAWCAFGCVGPQEL